MTCLFCGAEHTSAANWPEPEHSLMFRAEHEPCAAEYLADALASELRGAA